MASSPDEASARVIAGRLEELGIDAFVWVDDVGTGAVPIQSPAHVIVRPEDESAAREVLGDTGV